jgi:hypothetical protein
MSQIYGKILHKSVKGSESILGYLGHILQPFQKLYASMNTDAIGSLTDKVMQLVSEVEQLKKKSNNAASS